MEIVTLQEFIGTMYDNLKTDEISNHEIIAINTAYRKSKSFLDSYKNKLTKEQKAYLNDIIQEFLLSYSETSFVSYRDQLLLKFCKLPTLLITYIESAS